VTQAERGAARSPGITYQQLLDADTHPVPAVLRLETPAFIGDGKDVSKDRYTTKAWHDREVERLWMRVWQFACREEEIPTAGDYAIYEIAHLSFIVMRQQDGSIKAFPNACLHRGRRLKDYEGHCSELRCNFHGFAWMLNGALQDIPAQWDFSHVEPDNFGLPEMQVATWAGFVFINPDPNAEPFHEYAKELIEQFTIWPLGEYYTEARVAKVIQANWKITQEAFCEAYHVNGTHPQIMFYLGDTNSQVDVWENVSRVISPGGTPSPLLDSEPAPDDMLRSMLDMRLGEELPTHVPEGMTMRAHASALARERWRPIVGDKVDAMSDAEMMDSLDYTLFPNFHPWGAFNRIVYRFRPNGNDHRSSIMEVFFLSPFKGERPAPAPIHWLEEHESFSDATELGMLGKVFDQDLFNMGKVQIGLEATFKPGVTLSNYQEGKVRWLHHKLGEWVEG
jgi:phenylpropionate dioxygenase-like ring-hydroxylating dioxygenase large terminal subunit